MKTVKILFQGDSITDAGRDYSDCHNLGQGYPHYAAEQIQREHSECVFEFFNFGISGNRTAQVLERLHRDGIAYMPDIFSILIGINDIWHRYGTTQIETTYEQIEANYRAILEQVKKETKAKIIMLSPYLLDCENMDYLRPDLKELLPVVKRLAKEFADVYIPLDEAFEKALKTQPSKCYYSDDGVHPNANGAAFIGRLYADALSTLL